MQLIDSRNVNTAFVKGLHLLLDQGVEQPSRNGNVLGLTVPCLIRYRKPMERVLFNEMRNANPFFHLMESLWMLAGRRDVGWPKFFASNIANYSDDGITFWGAYGYRWRHWFHGDQIKQIIDELLHNPNSRRCVLQMWDGSTDMEKASVGGKDVPCNTAAYFDLRGGKLNMTVTNRSNDAIWGCFGANAVHFSMLQEYVASHINCSVGDYYQFTNNLHAYLDIHSAADLRKMVAPLQMYHSYMGATKPMPLRAPHEPVGAFDYDLQMLFGWWDNMANEHDRFVRAVPLFRSNFMAHVTRPMLTAWLRYKEDDLEAAAAVAGHVRAPDWRIACAEWVRNVAAKRSAA